MSPTPEAHSAPAVRAVLGRKASGFCILLAALRVMIGTCIALGVALSSIACRPSQDELAAYRARGLRIGYAVEAPYAFLAEAGRVTGLDPEVARRIAQRLGLQRVEWRMTEFHALIEDLEAGRFDVVAAGMFITRERERRIQFSLPTFSVQGAMLVARGNPARITSPADILSQAQLRVAALTGSVEEASLRSGGLDPARLINVPDAGTGCRLVATRRADALYLSLPTLRWALGSAEFADTEVIEIPPSSSPALGAFAFRKSDAALRAAWDEQLRSFVGSEEHVELLQRFGFGRGALPILAPGDSPRRD